MNEFNILPRSSSKFVYLIVANSEFSAAFKALHLKDQKWCGADIQRWTLFKTKTDTDRSNNMT